MGRFVERSAKQANVAGRGEYQCTYLIDDLASELDRPNRSRVLSILAESGAQCLLTAVEAKDLDLDTLIAERSGKFHVEHGKIQSYQ